MICLAPKRPKHGSLVQGHRRKDIRVQFPVPNAFVVRDVVHVPVHFFGATDELQLRPDHRAIPHELLPNAQGANDQCFAACLVLNQAHDLELHQAFAEPKLSKDSPLPTAYRPLNDVPLVRLENGADLFLLAVQTVEAGHIDLLLEKFLICHRFITSLTSRATFACTMAAATGGHTEFPTIRT